MNVKHAIIMQRCRGASCEAALYAIMPGAEPCRAEANYVIVDLEFATDEYPQGFHLAHVCAIHAMTTLRKAETGV